MNIILRDEYPRPDFVRDEWISLNGEWDFAFDDENQGLAQNWPLGANPFDRKIIVPFPFQSKLSGIGDPSSHPVIWYKREFTIPSEWAGKRILLNFGAVDFSSTIWINGRYAGSNSGGYVPFALDITELTREGANVITIRVVDDEATDQPRGKQSARNHPWGCWYTRVSGIWQSVWLEPVSEVHLKKVRLTPEIDSQVLRLEYELSKYEGNVALLFEASFNGSSIAKVEVPFAERFNHFTDMVPRRDGTTSIPINDPKLWSPEEPNLYDLTIRVTQDGTIVDEVKTYFGMREIKAENGRIYLNGRPYYLRMILDQGFWPDGIYTPSSAEDFKKDIEMTKAFGFNGARKHQKIEDPYYYYYCDKLGLLVWSEMPAAYYYTEESARNVAEEWRRAIIRDYNHPCIMAWVPVNESWGVDQLKLNQKVDPRLANHLDMLYHLTKSLDPTRLVISNDGWQHATTDLVTIHEYTQDHDDLSRRFQKFKEDPYSAPFSHKVPILLPGRPYNGQPMMITEFGGVKVSEQGTTGWGYGEDAATYSEMIERIRGLVEAILGEEGIAGYCYTQLTDVEQEVNGLMTYDRRPKCDPDDLKKVFRGR
ncbi:MAG: glycoside hydrolase family 2 [Firmicutes bacterium]|nr:glycoside hydrolase family 2 [Bacillota bacterium]